MSTQTYNVIINIAHLFRDLLSHSRSSALWKLAEIFYILSYRSTLSLYIYTISFESFTFDRVPILSIVVFSFLLDAFTLRFFFTFYHFLRFLYGLSNNIRWSRSDMPIFSYLILTNIPVILNNILLINTYIECIFLLSFLTLKSIALYYILFYWQKSIERINFQLSFTDWPVNHIYRKEIIFNFSRFLYLLPNISLSLSFLKFYCLKINHRMISWIIINITFKSSLHKI